MKLVTGHSIWLMPGGDTYKKLAHIIAQLSQEFKTPQLEPHVTLLEGLTDDSHVLASKASQLADILKPFTVKLREIDNSRSFDSVVVLVERTEDVTGARMKAEQIFNQKSAKNFMPHLTLLRKEIAQEQSEGLTTRIGNVFPISFRVEVVQLVPIGDDIEKWKPIKEVKLRQ